MVGLAKYSEINKCGRLTPRGHAGPHHYKLSELRLLPCFLPAIFQFPATNAFFEEVTFRSVLLVPLRSILGNTDMIWLAAFYFGIAHFYGIPYGIVGVVMVTGLGWLFRKSMVETNGLFWPWFIHFVQDVLIFSFVAFGPIVLGG